MYRYGDTLRHVWQHSPFEIVVMSRGLSRLQRGIYDLLAGKRRGLVYGSGGPLTTSELVEELIEAGLLADDIPQEQATFTVRRSCYGLVQRGLLKGAPSSHGEHAWIKTITWRAAVTPDSSSSHSPNVSETETDSDRFVS